jgi:hypothetical protein
MRYGPGPSRQNKQANRLSIHESESSEDHEDDDLLKDTVPRTAPLDMVISRVMGPPSRSTKRRADLDESSGRSGKRSQSGWESISSIPAASPLGGDGSMDDPVAMGICTEVQSRLFVDR